MNEIDGISVIAHIEIILNFETIIHMMYCTKKLTLVEFKLQQDHIILALITRISFKTTFYTAGNILKLLDYF